MQGRIHLVRHAEGLHNLRSDLNIPDAPLSQRGWYEAQELGRRFIKDNSNVVCAIVSSPLRRAIQTSLAAFPRILNSALSPEDRGRAVKLVLYANLQEISDYPANTGSSLSKLENEFPEIAPQIHHLDPKWYIKSGSNSPLPDFKAVILEELNRILESLTTTEEPEIIVVTHQGIISLLAPNVDIPMGQWKTFQLSRNGGEQLVLH
ncbi:Histidine phosphatase superfamily clade-1 [Penicillium argentinense]|uniref:Histidine phosphatase superfamily clade-1 n=1 Tax=Penicillium argentinense TaxID=1131581 RepID=A0A9W9G1J0_9EURO|nr:Histidine phosphatase superfamily clade-1 [Penicillium argentinense]KAJ5110378.1 Histidine phosphatase superfamily clade-1 [Penicillium argentinense]